jgi:hypothetical protein
MAWASERGTPLPPAPPQSLPLPPTREAGKTLSLLKEFAALIVLAACGTGGPTRLRHEMWARRAAWRLWPRQPVASSRCSGDHSCFTQTGTNGSHRAFGSDGCFFITESCRIAERDRFAIPLRRHNDGRMQTVGVRRIRVRAGGSVHPLHQRVLKRYPALLLILPSLQKLPRDPCQESRRFTALRIEIFCVSDQPDEDVLRDFESLLAVRRHVRSETEHRRMTGGIQSAKSFTITRAKTPQRLPVLNALRLRV